MNKIMKKRIYLTVMVCCTLGIAIGVRYYFYTPQPSAPEIITYPDSATGIFPYEAQRDKATALKLFQDNWYWLMGENSTLDPEYFLDHRSPTMQTKDHDRETIMVYRVKGETVGLLSYYPEPDASGRLHFIFLDERQRGKGFAQEMMDYVEQQLCLLGSKKIWLATRTDNIPAQKLYVRNGYKAVVRTDRYVRFEKKLGATC